MKKIFLLFSLFSVCSYAQIREENNVELSPFIGYLRSDYFGGKTTKSTESIGNIQIGVNLDVYLNNRISLKTGLEFVTLGSSANGQKFIITEEGEGKYIDSKFKDHLYFIGVPFHVNIHIGKKRNWNLDLGPTLSYMLTAKKETGLLFEDVNKLQLGWSFAAGYRIPVSETFAIIFEYQQYYGFINNNKKSRYPNYRSLKAVNNYYGAFNIKGVFNL